MRAYHPQQMVDVPGIDAESAPAFATALKSAAGREKHLPALIQRALQRFIRESRALDAALASRLDAAPAIDTRAADEAEDAPWRGLYSWLRGFAELPAHLPESEVAGSILRGLFPDRLRFLRLPYAKEWAAVSQRIEQMAREHYDQQILALGGASFLAAIRAAHEQYGVAIGVTAPKASGDGPAVRERMQSMMAAARSYIVKVVAHVEDDDPQSQKLAERLLRPIVDWPGRTRPGPNGDPIPVPAGHPTGSPAQ